MISRIAKFNKALEKYFSELKLDKKGGQEKVCLFSAEKFYITAEDIEFYKKMQVPLPTLSPHERMRRRLGFLNLYNLFYGKSAKTEKDIISSYPADTLYKIYEHTIWNDADFTDQAVEYDPKRKFFEQYEDFQLAVPRPNLIIRNSVDSDYTHTVINVKNCHLVFDTETAEDSQFCGFVNNSKNYYHSYAATGSDIGYDNLLSKKLYKCFFVEFSKNCIDSSFLFDCRHCQHCFMCTNLRHKKYCFENKQLTKEEYEKKIEKVNLGDRKKLGKWKDKFIKLKKESIHRANHNERNINCTGDYNWNCKNCSSSYYSVDSENMNYVIAGVRSQDCMDVAVCLDSELVYDSIPWDENAYNIKFSAKNGNLRDSEYCDLCRNCHDCFACIGLKNKAFCIFNKQYSEGEYFEKLDEIKTKMLADGEYGEFFPPKLCPFPYQITSAASFQGYDDIETAEKYGYHTEKVPGSVQNRSGRRIFAEDVPVDIREVDDGILDEVIVDLKNDKKFKYTREELEFHRKHNLALPIEHYSAILARKRIELGPIDFSIKTRKCSKCKQETQVTFPENHPDAPENIWCEKCYNQEIN